MFPAFLPKDLLAKSKIVRLPHPRNSKINDFLVENGRIFEIQLVDRPHSSWFIDNYVVSNGNCILVHQIHPLFLVIPYMLDHIRELSPKADFFYGTPYKAIEELVFPYFERVCDTMASEFDVCYCLSKTKLHNWLLGRVEALIPYFKKKQEMPDNQLVEICYGVLRHYIPPSIQSSLKEGIISKYPGSFPPKVLDLIPAPTFNDDFLSDKPAKKTTKAPPKTAPKPKSVPAITNFFSVIPKKDKC